MPMQRVLLITVALGWSHRSIPRGAAVVSELARRSGGLEVDVSAAPEELSPLDRAMLARYAVLLFANSSGSLPLDEEQRQAILDAVAGGTGLLGFHGASDTLHEWPAYGELIGARFKEHPWTQQ